MEEIVLQKTYDDAMKLKHTTLPIYVDLSYLPDKTIEVRFLGELIAIYEPHGLFIRLPVGNSHGFLNECVRTMCKITRGSLEYRSKIVTDNGGIVRNLPYKAGYIYGWLNREHHQLTSDDKRVAWVSYDGTKMRTFNDMVIQQGPTRIIAAAGQKARLGDWVVSKTREKSGDAVKIFHIGAIEGRREYKYEDKIYHAASGFAGRRQCVACKTLIPADVDSTAELVKKMKVK